LFGTIASHHPSGGKEKDARLLGRSPGLRVRQKISRVKFGRNFHNPFEICLQEKKQENFFFSLSVTLTGPNLDVSKLHL
jgi:hypothetical protein